MTATNGAGTPLSRYGTRVPTVPPRHVSTATRAITSPAPTTSTAVTPPATIRTMIVCLPDGLPAQALTAAHLDRLFGVSGTPQPRFWASPALWPWHRRQLIAPRTGRPLCCAGGPVRLLDLAGMRHAAGLGAGIRFQLWQRVVHGTPPARPWPTYLARHLADPARYPLPRAQADFHHQPRVNALRLHNAASVTAGLPVPELEMFQAGPAAYQQYSAATGVCGDALLTVDGHTLSPADDALCHRVTYLEQALRYLDTVDPGQRLLAVAL